MQAWHHLGDLLHADSFFYNVFLFSYHVRFTFSLHNCFGDNFLCLSSMILTWYIISSQFIFALEMLLFYDAFLHCIFWSLTLPLSFFLLMRILINSPFMVHCYCWLNIILTLKIDLKVNSVNPKIIPIILVWISYLISEKIMSDPRS